MIPHATAVTLIIALVALAALITLARVVGHVARVRQRSPEFLRALKVREKYRGQG